MLSKYLHHTLYGWGSVEEIAGKATTLWFPQIGCRKRFYTHAIADQIIEKCPEAIRGLNESYRAAIAPERLTKFWSTGGTPARSARCYVCKKHVDSDDDLTCDYCKWIICPRDGACGCGFGL